MNSLKIGNLQGARDRDDYLFTHAAMLRDEISRHHAQMTGAAGPPVPTTSTSFLRQSHHARWMAIADFPVSDNANGLNKARNVEHCVGLGLSSHSVKPVDLDVVHLLVDRALR